MIGTGPGTRGFETVYGRGMLAAQVETLERYLVITHPELWTRLEPTVGHPPEQVMVAADLTPAHLDRLARTMPPVDAVIGIGGGTAIDTAKWLHWRSSVPLYLLPSLPSVNAPFLRPVGVRRAGRLSYEGDAEPVRVLIDFDLMWSAPPALVRAGIGDVLSCHTASFDWDLAARAGVAPAPDAEIVTVVSGCLTALIDLAPDLAAGRDDALQRLIECHRILGWCRNHLGHARFAEGSEHWFASALEARVDRRVMHGELVTLGVLVMAAIQANDPELPRKVADAAGMRTELDVLGLDWSQVEWTLRNLRSHVEEHQLGYSVASELMVDGSVVALAREALRVTG